MTTAANTPVTVQAAVIGPVTNGLVVVAVPAQPLMPVSVKPEFAVAAQVVLLPNVTGLGVQVKVPPPATTTLVVTGNDSA